MKMHVVAVDPDCAAFRLLWESPTVTDEDFQANQASVPCVPPNHITSIREKRYKLAKSYDVDGTVSERWEMSDLEKDSRETRNIDAAGFKKIKEQ